MNVTAQGTMIVAHAREGQLTPPARLRPTANPRTARRDVPWTGRIPEEWRRMIAMRERIVAWADPLRSQALGRGRSSVFRTWLGLRAHE